MSNEVKYLIVGDVNAQGSILFDSISAVDVPTPPAGKFALFNDQSNGNRLSSKDSGGIVTVVGSGGEDMLIQNYAPTTATIELNPDTNIYTITVSSATTFVFDTTALNLVAGQACTFELDLTMSTVSTLTFPASVSWIYGAPYMGDAGKIYRLVFHSMDQGASWHANLAFERSIA